LTEKLPFGLHEIGFVSAWSVLVAGNSPHHAGGPARPGRRTRLAAIWTDPKSLDPSTQSARVTREVADLLATISRRLEARGHSAEAVSGFLMRLLFTMFAEDTGVLLPKDSFKTLLRGQLDHPNVFRPEGWSKDMAHPPPDRLSFSSREMGRCLQRGMSNR